jgi:chromosome segregation ATPase
MSSAEETMEQRLRAAQQLHGQLQASLRETQDAEKASREAAASASEEAKFLSAEIRDLEAEGAQLRADIDGARRALQEERQRASEEAAAAEAAIAAREAELAAQRRKHAATLKDAHAATAAAADVAAQLRAAAVQRATMAEEAATLRARLTEKRALHIHAELVAVTRAARQGGAALTAKLEETRATRVRYQEELTSLTSELQALRLQIAAAISKKEHAAKSECAAFSSARTAAARFHPLTPLFPQSNLSSQRSCSRTRRSWSATAPSQRGSR